MKVFGQKSKHRQEAIPEKPQTTLTRTQATLPIMKKLILLFNHICTQEQEADARTSLGIEQIVAPPQDILKIWSDLPPDLEKLSPQLQPVFAWLQTEMKPGDFVLVQGDFGAVYLVAQFVFANGCTPVYSTTERRAREQILEDGSVQLSHSFRHIRFRKYGA